MLFFGPLVIMVVLMGIMVRARAGDRRTDLRRCPKCWYDMPDSDSMKCPECGFTASSKLQFFQPRRYTTTFRIAATSFAVVFGVCIWTLIPGRWTNKVPRPVLRLALTMVEPYSAADLSTPQPTLSLPNPAFQTSSSSWERALWLHEANQCFRQWGEAVQSNTGPITDAELATLVPLANQANAIFVKTGGLSNSEGWLSDGARDDLAATRRALNADPQTPQTHLQRIEWALSELQYFGGDYTHRPDWAATPDAIIVQALNHPSPQVRIFGLDRAGKRSQQTLIVKGAAVPPVIDQIKTMAASDPDPSVRKRAADLKSYIEAFNIK